MVEGLLIMNAVIMLVGFTLLGMFPSRHRDPRLDTALASMARLEQSALATAKLIDDVHTTQEKDQRIRHDLRDYMQTLEVRVVRLEERLRAPR